MKFVDVTNDIAFRKIFGNENRKEVLISFLNAVLLLENNNKIVSVDILDPFQLPAIKGGKVTIVDIKAKDQNQKSYIVEMQVAEPECFDKRVLFYASKSYTGQIERGDEYKKLNPTFFIGILNFEVTQNKNYLSRHKIIDIETGENIIKDIEFNFIELPKFNKSENQLTSIIDQWVYFIKNAENLAIIPDNITDEALKTAYQDANMHNWTKAELDAYDYGLMREQDEKGVVELQLKRAEEKGIEKGIEKGLEKGKIEVVKNAVKIGLSTQDIIQLTGLSKEEIEIILQK